MNRKELAAAAFAALRARPGEAITLTDPRPGDSVWFRRQLVYTSLWVPGIVRKVMKKTVDVDVVGTRLFTRSWKDGERKPHYWAKHTPTARAEKATLFRRMAPDPLDDSFAEEDIRLQNFGWRPERGELVLGRYTDGKAIASGGKRWWALSVASGRRRPGGVLPGYRPLNLVLEKMVDAAEAVVTPRCLPLA